MSVLSFSQIREQFSSCLTKPTEWRASHLPVPAHTVKVTAPGLVCGSSSALIFLGTPSPTYCLFPSLSGLNILQKTCGPQHVLGMLSIALPESPGKKHQPIRRSDEQPG